MAVEEIISGLKNAIERGSSLEQAKQSHRADQKINIIKDQLPSILMIEGKNPLKSLYKHLSIGIHSLSDDECLKKAKNIRNILVFIITILVNTQNSHKNYKNSFNELEN